MNADKDENIRAEHTFFERSRIDRKKAKEIRTSPDIIDMWGAQITSNMPAGGEKITYYYWMTKKRRDECLPRLLSKYIKPKVKLINKK